METIVTETAKAENNGSGRTVHGRVKKQKRIKWEEAG